MKHFSMIFNIKLPIHQQTLFSDKMKMVIFQGELQDLITYNCLMED